jgi:hypothetical protein
MSSGCGGIVASPFRYLSRKYVDLVVHVHQSIALPKQGTGEDNPPW